MATDSPRAVSGTTPDSKRTNVLVSCRFSLLCSLLAAACFLRTAQAAGAGDEVPLATVSSAFHRAILFTYAPTRKANMVCSPLSLWRVMRLLQTGADDSTLQEMKSLVDLENVNLDAPDLTWSIVHGDTDIVVHAADRLFASPALQDSTFNQYCSVVGERYNAEVETIDFGASPASAAEEISNFVRHITMDFVPRAVAPYDISSETRLALVNALYLKAQWDTPFEAAGPGEFASVVGEGRFVDENCHFMKKVVRDLDLEYLDGPTKVVRLPYRNLNLALYLFMPERLDSFEQNPEFAQVLDETIDYMHSNLHERRQHPESHQGNVQVVVPQFSLNAGTNGLDVSRVLRSMGIRRLFHRANLSRLTDTPHFGVEIFKHAAAISVDQQQTIAAAATTVGMSPNAELSRPPVTRRLEFNSPLIFQIRYQPHYEVSGPGPAKYDLILFSGHIVSCGARRDLG